jgi:putative metallohydrolase (TIGR04338 family)
VTTIKTQQQQVYRAQRDVPLGRRFKSITEVQEYLDGMRDTWWWHRWYWRIPRVEVYAATTEKTSMAGWDEANNAGLIILHKENRDQRALVHELAHVVAEALHNSHAHDPAYCRDYANLTYLIMGGDAWLKLQEGFEREKVEY